MYYVEVRCTGLAAAGEGRGSAEGCSCVMHCPCNQGCCCRVNARYDISPALQLLGCTLQSQWLGQSEQGMTVSTRSPGQYCVCSAVASVIPA